jgi:hypothetical protein
MLPMPGGGDAGVYEGYGYGGIQQVSQANILFGVMSDLCGVFDGTL